MEGFFPFTMFISKLAHAEQQRGKIVNVKKDYKSGGYSIAIPSDTLSYRSESLTNAPSAYPCRNVLWPGCCCMLYFDICAHQRQ